MGMTHEWLAALLVTGGVITAGLLTFAIRAVRDIARMTRAVAGLVYQEEEKTRTLIKDVSSRPSS